MNIKKLINWKLYFVLLAASVVSIIAMMPYALSIQADVLKDLPIPLPLALLLSVIQGTVLVGILLFIGLKLSKKLGLKIPILEAYLKKESDNIDIKPVVKSSIGLGFLAGVLIILFDLLFIQFGVIPMEQLSVPIWKGFLASFYGGITEEIIMRLFFMTFVIWLISKFRKSKDDITNSHPVMWFSIIIAAILFGIGHLPATAALIDLTPLVVFRALLLNGIGAVIFGWLYWKKGLEAGMIAHFSTDIILHVVFPFILLII